MKKLLTTLSAVLLLVVVGAGKGFCAQVAGTVTDLSGAKISGAVVSARDSAGNLLGQAVTNSEGQYSLTGLAPGQYQYALQVSSLGFKDGSATANLTDSGLTMDWKVSDQAAAVALATEGLPTTGLAAAGALGLSGATLALLLGGSVVVAGGVIGGYAAAGGFNGPSGPPPSPPASPKI